MLKYAKARPGEHIASDAVNLVIAATRGDWRMLDVISDEHPEDDARNADLVAELVAFTMAIMRGIHPDDRAHILDHARGEADMEWIAERAEIDDFPTFRERCGMYAM